MIDYGERPDNQSRLPLTAASTEMLAAREWVKANPDAWEKYMLIAKSESYFGSLSPSYVVEILRHRHHVSIRSDWKPILARLAMEQDPEINFRLARSRFDGFCEAVL